MSQWLDHVILLTSNIGKRPFSKSASGIDVCRIWTVNAPRLSSCSSEIWLNWILLETMADWNWYFLYFWTNNSAQEWIFKGIKKGLKFDQTSGKFCLLRIVAYQIKRQGYVSNAFHANLTKSWNRETCRFMFLWYASRKFYSGWWLFKFLLIATLSWLTFGFLSERKFSRAFKLPGDSYTLF